MSYINVKVRLCDIIVLNMHILRIKMMLKRTVFMKKWNSYLISSLGTRRKFSK